MEKVYRIAFINDPSYDEDKWFWRKALLVNENDDSDSIIVNLNPHAERLSSAVAIHDDGHVGGTFVLSNLENRGSLDKWSVGDSVSIEL